MKILRSLAILAFTSFTSIMAQTQNIALSLEDLIPGGKTYQNYQVKAPQQPIWWGDKMIQVDNKTIREQIKLSENENIEIVDINTINNKLKEAQLNEIGTLLSVSFPYPTDSILLISIKDKYVLYDFAKNKIKSTYSIPPTADNIKFNANNKSYTYTIGNNLYLRDSTDKEQAITFDKDVNIVNGQAVHRNEFGINTGTFWSPDATKLAFYRMDETMVTDYPLVDISQPIATLKSIKYPMAGNNSHEVTIGVFNTETNKTIFLKTGMPKDKYLTNIQWSPNSDFIYIAELNRQQDTCTIARYDAQSGELNASLFTETHPKYVEPEHPVLFLKNKPDQFIWQSKRDGNNHLYLYDTKGKIKKQLTKGNWDVTEILSFDESGDNLFYLSTEISPIEKHIYKLNIKTQQKTLLSKEEGVHKASLSHSGNYIIDEYSSLHNPLKIDIIDTKTGNKHNLYEATNPYKGIDMPQITLGTLKATDHKTDLYYRMVKPLNFDSLQQYPVIVYVYGGPHSQLVDNSWMGQVRGWDIYMAEKGYIVFTLDNRGTSNRGLDFENITHRQLGVIETEDQMAGIHYLKTLPYVDTNKIGVHGWSFGGFMTLNLMLRHPDIFKVGVAGGSVTDWKYYEIMYGERYMDSPQENPQGYETTSMINRAKDLKGKLMLIHGDEDPVVVMQHSLQFLKAAIKNGTHPDFFIYPGHQHNMTGHDRVHLHEHITRYFDQYLKQKQ